MRFVIFSPDGVRIDTDGGWSDVVADTPEGCRQLAGEFMAAAIELEARPLLVAQWARNYHEDDKPRQEENHAT